MSKMDINKQPLILLIGELVEFHKGGLGTVIEASAKPEIGNETKQSCCILWHDNEYRGNPYNAKKGRSVSISISTGRFDEHFIVKPIVKGEIHLNPNLKSYAL